METGTLKSQVWLIWGCYGWLEVTCTWTFTGIVQFEHCVLYDSQTLIALTLIAK